MNMVSQDSARANRILGALPLTDYMPLASQFEPMQLQAGQVIEAAGASHSHVHFPVAAPSPWSRPRVTVTCPSWP